MVVDLSLPEITALDVLAFMEYLAQSGLSPDNITNHITGTRSMSIIYGLNTVPFRDQRIPLFVKSLKINRFLAPVVKLVIDHTALLQIFTVSDHLQFPLVYKALYLLAFFSFLRISNILPHAARNFDKTRHLCVGDVIFAFQRAVIVVKWSKTLQDRVKTTTIDILCLGASAICPIAALKQMLATYPSHQDASLFQIPHAGSLKPLTDSAASSKSLVSWDYTGPSHSMISVGEGLLGPFSMESPFGIFRPRGLGHPIVFGDILPSLPPNPKFQLHSGPTCMPSLFSLLLLGVWAPSFHYYITL